MSVFIDASSSSAKSIFNTTYPTNDIQWCWLSLQTDKQKAISLESLENTWVRLIDNSNPDLWQEVLLLCSKSDTEWVVWNPEYGEETLSIDQFCLVPIN